MSELTNLDLFAKHESDETKKITKMAAHRAAQKAMNDFIAENKAYESSHGAFAVYAWAAVAFIGLSVAGSSLILPNSDHQQTASQEVNNSDSLTTASTRPADQAIVIDHGTSLEDEEKVLAENAQAFPVQDGLDVEDDLSTVAAGNGQTFGATVGKASDLNTLIRRYSALQDSSAINSDEFDPLINFLSLDKTPQAELVAGPFTTQTALSSFCNAVRLQLALDCTQTSYAGDRLFGE